MCRGISMANIIRPPEETSSFCRPAFLMRWRIKAARVVNILRSNGNSNNYPSGRPAAYAARMLDQALGASSTGWTVRLAIDTTLGAEAWEAAPFGVRPSENTRLTFHWAKLRPAVARD